MDEAAAANEFGSGLRAHLGFEHEAGFAAPELSPPAPSEHHEAPLPDPREEELAERLAYLAIAEGALAERERRVAEREDHVHAREEELERETAHAVDLRQLLRWRAEQHGETVWSAFDEALHASTPDGHPDHPIRIAAARALLAEAYSGVGAAALEDELAQLRARRSAFGS